MTEIHRKESGARTSLWQDYRLLLWNFLMVLLAPWLLAHKFRRSLKGTDLSDRDMRRWNPPMSGLRGSRRKHFVIAGACYGELLLMEKLTRLLAENDPCCTVTWMLRDPKLYDEVIKDRPEQRVCLWPFDFIIPVDRCLRLLNPDVLVLAERFRFTNLVCGASALGMKVVLLNGRFKPIHFVARTFFSGIYRWNMNSIDLAIMQSAEQAARARAYSANPGSIIAVNGLKDQISLERIGMDTNGDLAEWLKRAAEVPVFVAGSTDGIGEEKLVFDAFRKVRNQMPCRLILAPRKLHRVAETESAGKEMGFSVGLRSQNQPERDVLILDTLGELAHSYEVATATYVGGFFDGMGHNLMESVFAGKPVCFGPREGHFGPIQRESESRGVGFRINSPAELADIWVRLLSDETFARNARAACLEWKSEVKDPWIEVGHRIEKLVADHSGSIPFAETCPASGDTILRKETRRAFLL